MFPTLGAQQRVSPCTWMMVLMSAKREKNKSHMSRAKMSSMRKQDSKDIASDSVELCETDVCCLHIRLVGTKIRLLKMSKIPPDVDVESSTSPAKSESCNSTCLQCSAVFFSHMTILLECTRVVCVRNHTSQAYVTGLPSISFLFVPICSQTINLGSFRCPRDCWFT